MPYSRRIVLLANSRKHSGRCIAGRVWNNGRFGPWVRPVSHRGGEEISSGEMEFEDGSEPELLDIVRIHMIEARSQSCQTENHLIDDGRFWSLRGELPEEDLAGAIESPDCLWNIGVSSGSGINDRMSESDAEGFDSSLVLVELDELSIQVGRSLRGAKQVRGQFRYNENTYDLAVTDPDVEGTYRVGARAQLRDVAICVSVGEPFRGFRYKLIASVIQL